MRLNASTDDVRTARDFVAERLRQWNCTHLVEVARVLTSELVSNAVLHGRSPITVAVMQVGDGVRVEVTDGGPGRPEVRSVDLEVPGGMGLVIVANLATRWGVDATDAGKTAWFELAT